MDISSPWTFRHGEFSARELFGTMNFWHQDISAQGYLDTMNVSTQGHYGTGSFRHMDILVLWAFWHLIRNICAEMSILLCKVPKFRYAETSICCNIPMPSVEMSKVPKYPCTEMLPCRNVLVPKFPVPKSPLAKMSLCRNVCGAKSYTCRNVTLMKCPC